MTFSSPLVLLVLLIGLGVGAALGYALAVARAATARAGGRDEAASARTDAAQWRARAEELEQRAVLAEERAERDGSVLRALAPVRAQLEQVGARVEMMERERAAQHATLSEQLRAGARAEEELRRTTAALTGALRSRSSRGLWGEVELARVLEASGMLAHVDFFEQRSVASVLASRSGGPGGVAGAGSREGDGSRPDVVVRLPGDGFLALDAKVPMDAYLRAAGLGGEGGGPDGGEPDEAERRRLLAAHAAALRSHVDALASRGYDRALGASPELVVLFVPAEPVLAAALEADPTLMEHALGRGVALASPASLLALLRTCASAWARTAVTEDAQELLELGRTLYERLGTVAGHLDALGASLTRSVSSYNRTVASLESRLLVTARSLDSLASEVPSPRQVSPDDAQVRALTAPELTRLEGQERPRP
ncbi:MULTISPECIES: DNA recombination protein RmuC [unclassified Actinomyces]|uniref:DNA recombination protein RmuC n=1 Tax=unclassified Actinomyces TaxID=2609248 RepID=UPI0020176970|nr:MULTISPECIES: DNA recombination protein RmuC [unclassified Actinomyces]MCL3776862.1 DNA recombination protein RmuC [Actinomyces sp. AC-20-1]MCL3790850.1 DNA recombination protein RmuC [Actinomyces sp. 187325]MCL3793114.1 DNA recombination protein RmuC [Actinomyces sp. 186855]MCL3794665.1 DNA recombination protein RmuC [Actinomyces sp. 217892]